MPKINRDALVNCSMWYPSRDEQTALLVYVDEARKPFDTAIDRYEREITLLREYRTRLVADVVTGKLDVREAALLLPEEDVVVAPEDVVDEAEEPELEEAEG
jgi:type I restriction enzyme S subunit